MPLVATWSLAAGCGDSGHTLGNARDAAAGATGTGGSTPGNDAGAAGVGGHADGGGAGRGGAGGTAVGGSGGSGGHGGGAGAGGAGGSGGAGGTGGTGGAGGAPACSALPLVACPSGQVCDYNTPGRCAAGYEPGRCLVLPGGCTADYNPVCGCDGHTYGNDCERVIARVQLDHAGACASTADAGTDGSRPPLVDCANLPTCGSGQQFVKVGMPALGVTKCACVPTPSAGRCMDCSCGASICAGYSAGCSTYSQEGALLCVQNG